MEERVERQLEAEDERVCCEIVSPRNVKSYTHKASPTWMPKHELNRDGTNIYANMDRESS